MTTTPLPPAIEPVAWFEYARKKPTLKRLVFDRTSRSQLRVAGWVSEPLIKESDAQQARADLEAENANLRLELQSARDINLAVVNRQQAEIEALRKKLAQARKDEADALRAADAVYEAQERADDAYRAGSSGY